MSTDDLPEIIKSQADACAFCWWLDRHPEITQLQGYVVERSGIDGAMFCGLSHAGRLYVTLDIRDLMSNRAMLNDWIRTYRGREVRHGA